MLIALAYPYSGYPADAVIDVPDALAHQLIGDGRARRSGAATPSGTDARLVTFSDLVNYAPTVVWDGVSAQPPRPVTQPGHPVVWFAPTRPAGGGTVGGQAGAVDGLDIVFTP